MKARSENIHFNVLSLAVKLALAAMFTLPVAAQAEDDEVAALTQPKNFVEFGGIFVSESSAKFGEYTGLNDSGAEALGNLSIRGGSAYGGGDGTMRGELKGTDLGLTSRAVSGSLSDQGLWDLNVGYDGLRHNISDSYQTPLLGSPGDNNLTLPANFGTIDGNHGGTDLPFDTASIRTLTPNQLGDFHRVDVYTDRDNMSFGAGYHFDRRWSVRLDYNHLEQTGAKLLGTGNQGGIALLGGSTSRAEANNIILNPTEYTTDTINLDLNWQGDQAHVSIGYHGSLFQDKYNSLSWQAAQASDGTCVGTVACFTNNTMSTAPDNQFHQFNLTGGWVFSPTTKVAGGFSYGVNTQDDSYAPTLIAQATGTSYNMMQAGGLPQASLDGEVVNTHADLKLTNKTTRALTLSGGVTYNERDNNTASRTYLYHNLGNSNYTGVNLPYSNRKIQGEVAADYRVTRDQKLHVGYEHEFIERWCDGVVGGAECVSSPSSDEDKVGITYRVRASETLNLHAGYAYANRSTDLDHTFAANTGSYPQLNAQDKLGYVAYIYDSRTQNSVKAGLNWQATDKLDLSLDGRYAKADYDALLGVQDGDDESVNMDATYAYSEKGSFSAYAGWQGSSRTLRNGKDGSQTVAPTQIWNNDLSQDSYAFGLNAMRNGMMDGKLKLVGDVSYSYDTSHYSTQVPYDATCATVAVLTCGDTPDITARLFTVKLTGDYQVNKNGKLALGYTYQHLNSNDYFYNALQYGYTPDRVMPTNEQEAGYSEHVVTLSYTYSF